MSVNITAGVPAILDEATPSARLGQQYISPDGRKYRYVKAGGSALTVGNVLQAAVEVTGNENLAFAAAALGATSVTTTSTVTVTANQYAGGYLTVSVTPDLGATYRIKSHPAATGATLTIQLEEGLRTAWTTSTRADMVRNPYDAVLIAPTTPTGMLVGVAVNDISANQYGWIQSAGPCNVLTDSGGVTLATGDVVLSNASAGCVESWVSGQPKVGRAMTGIAASENGMIFLELD